MRHNIYQSSWHEETPEREYTGAGRESSTVTGYLKTLPLPVKTYQAVPRPAVYTDDS